MPDNNQNSPTDPASDIRIIAFNTDKTRRMVGSETMYQVYFELSASPPVAWRIAFDAEWKTMHIGQPLALQETSIDRAFLVIHCPLQEIPIHLPVLKKAITATNTLYANSVRKASTEEADRENVWKNERNEVEKIANSIHF